MKNLLQAAKRLRDIIVQECREKHLLDPTETDLNEDYHVELTLSIKEVREFLKAINDEEEETKRFDELYRDANRVSSPRTQKCCGNEFLVYYAGTAPGGVCPACKTVFWY